MIPVPRHVIYGAFDWYGLVVTVDGTRFKITSGRVGNLSNPLVFTKDRVQGGWYIPTTEIELSDSIERIDVLYKDRQAYLMFRTDDAQERYPDEYTLLLALAWKDNATWYVAVPERDRQYEKDMCGSTHNNIR